MQSKFYVKIHVIKHDMDPNTSRKTPALPNNLCMEDVLIEFSGSSSTIMSAVSFSQGAQASFYMLSSLVIIDADCPLRFRTYCK